jgi:hypothetical protein
MRGDLGDVDRRERDQVEEMRAMSSRGLLTQLSLPGSIKYIAKALWILTCAPFIVIWFLRVPCL